MKYLITFSLFVLLLPISVLGQGVSDPLLYQGLENYNPMSARTRAMGGAAVTVGNDVGAMFSNPAILAQLPSLQIHIGGRWTDVEYDQTQRWTPNRFYADLSLMFENNFYGIKDPDAITDSTDLLHKPYDDITPGWSKNRTVARPSLMAAGIPFTFLGMPVAAGIGYAEMINLNHYYQNNNAIAPNIGEYRPDPIPIVASGDTLLVQWYQFIRERKGSIYGIIPSIAVTPFEGLNLGFSLAILNGSSDDNQWRVDRGHLRFLYNRYFLDSIDARTAMSGTSDYSGILTTIGCIYTQDYYSIGFSLRPPATITREWSQISVEDMGDTLVNRSMKGTDKLKMPWFYTIGLALYPSEKITIGVDYAMQKFSDVTYSGQDYTSSPWVNSRVFRVGIEYHFRKWLNIRGGAREEAQAFVPAGEGLIGEPVSGAAYTTGFGINVGNITIDASYEYGTLKYNDLWQSNVNTNRITSHTGMLELGYTFN
jgi:opacity protein-like surface antigen